MSSHKNVKVVFLTPYPADTAPGQRFRYEQYLDLLQKKGYTIRYYSFLTHNHYRHFYDASAPFKLLVLLIGFLRTIIHFVQCLEADFVFIYREVTLGGPPVFEFLLAKVLRKKIIYDFDDAIWLTDNLHESRLERWLRWRSKVKSICHWSYRISCGNAYLAAYARQFNHSVIVNPTTIDTINLHNPELVKTNKNNEKIVVGWTGSHSTLKYLDLLVPVFQELEKEFPQLHFLVIANRNPGLPLQRCSFVSWSKESEAKDLARMDIGVMPLPDDEWTRGKCGFKALQYMAMEIPCIASPVGVNTEIIQHGKNGFLASTADEWKACLKALITDELLRKKIGKAGREQVIQRYSVESNSALFFSLFA